MEETTTCVFELVSSKHFPQPRPFLPNRVSCELYGVLLDETSEILITQSKICPTIKLYSILIRFYPKQIGRSIHWPLIIPLISRIMDCPKPQVRKSRDL
jgi:hypothetical protein